MDKWKVAVVEDDDFAARTIEEYFKKYAKEFSCEFEVKKFSCGKAFLADKTCADILLMDIDLPDANGMELVKDLRKTDLNTVVIFVTNLAQYAVEGYSVDALDFIVKPASYYNFAAKLKRATTRATGKKSQKFWITLKNGGGLKKIDTAKLYYVEVSNHTLVYHTTDGAFETIGTLAAAKKQLPNGSFVLCNRCYLVNLNYVEAVGKGDVKVGGDTLLISHLKRAEFMQKFNLFLAGDTLGND